MSLRVAVDFGTSSTCVVASLYGREPQVVMIDGHPLLPSSVYCAEDGTLFVGREAERQAAVDPSRYEPNPKRRIDEGELLLGTTVVPVLDAIRAVLERAISEARRLAGGAEVDLLVLTHPADWGVIRTGCYGRPRPNWPTRSPWCPSRSPLLCSTRPRSRRRRRTAPSSTATRSVTCWPCSTWAQARSTCRSSRRKAARPVRPGTGCWRPKATPASAGPTSIRRCWS